MSKEKLIIKKKIKIPMFGTWKWNKNDFETPLSFPLVGANALLFLDPVIGGPRDRDIIFEAILEICFSPVPEKVKKGLNSSGKQSTDLAEKIYNYYFDVFQKFEALLLSAANIKNLFVEAPMTIEQFYSNGFPGEAVTWSLNESEPITFKPKIQKGRRRINPLFKRDQLIDKEKWQRLQDAINEEIFPQDEIIEILKIRTKINKKRNKIAVIEASILIETILRQYLEKTLKTFGFSNNKIKSLRDELTFNSMLNLVTPLTLSKAESKAIQVHIDATNSLRKIRNDLVHGNVSEDKVEMSNIVIGIEGALKLISLLKQEKGVKSALDSCGDSW